ncbi:MAG: type 2 isopentenyl-diphosphate Delta-isomerase, partial [Proteobacteria bacterium]|nr:type 2 isopentenyl-diphosphate Delta-isomerase [Pseudomonadota bacterium]
MSRKMDHLVLCSTDDVAFRKKETLLSEVTLIHNALPELAASDVDLTTSLARMSIKAPLVIAAMTGGIDEAEQINRDLAAVAQEHGIAFGFGSMRPLVERGILKGYQVRDEAPDIPLLGNIGVVQAANLTEQAIADLIGSTDINALAIHLNPAMEAFQEGGDNNFRGNLDTIARLRHDLPIPLIVKETSCGISRTVGRQLARIGIEAVDVSGAGGTSWIGVETLRCKNSHEGAGLGNRRSRRDRPEI